MTAIHRFDAADGCRGVCGGASPRSGVFSNSLHHSGAAAVAAAAAAI
ncbi:MAG: hypothetical protein JWM18_5143 [Chloroflexi bacterium]|jgi:hypothetical protein|nr:hypothetical protein [Chloroflexota bacterium]